MSWVNCDPMSRMRIRELIGEKWFSARLRRPLKLFAAAAENLSKLPLWTLQRQKLHLLRVQVEQRRTWSPEQPAACLAWIDEQRVALRLHVLLMREAVHDHAVRHDGPLL